MSIKMYGTMDQAIAGLSFGLDAETESFCAGEDIYPGDPLFGMVGDEKMAYKAHLNAVTLTANKDLITANRIAVTVNGIAVDPVVFISSSANTIVAIVNAINLNDEIRDLGITAFAAQGSDRVFSLEGPGITITASAEVTLGASQATFTAAANSSAKFIGVARFEQLAFGKDVGFYPKGVVVSVLSFGKIYVPVADDAEPADKKPAYVVLSGEDSGTITEDDDGNYDCGCIFRSGRVSGNLALLEVRGLK
jgi:hypothetical protein